MVVTGLPGSAIKVWKLFRYEFALVEEIFVRRFGTVQRTSVIPK
jgi:hypothetical protein